MSNVTLTASSLDSLIEAAKATLQPGRPEVQTQRRQALKDALSVVVAERAVHQFLDSIEVQPEQATPRRERSEP